VFGQGRLRRFLSGRGRIAAIVATHAHEEHIGNCSLAARLTGSPVFATETTLKAMRSPEPLSTARRTFVGQPEPSDDVATRPMGQAVETASVRLEVIESPGHCAGHASLYEPVRGILFAGDSFLHTVFTAPNRDVSAARWIETLETYGQHSVRTLIGTHGYVYSIDPQLPPRAFVVKRADPQLMIRDKLAFMRWARAVVVEGERRALPYPVIEACLFPWSRWWSWHNWFGDEAIRLFSSGEFSRTYFVRSLSATPERVPPRFPPFARLAAWLRGTAAS
jgi:glyoxylase-like metal-dependent hydrolase (beta-lactamase superfamily II)